MGLIIGDNTLIKAINKQYEDLLVKYICAKDKNKPSLMKEVFTDSSSLQMNLKTQNISFPAKTIGLKNITDVLVDNFNKNYENIFTFCLKDTMKYQDNGLTCDWVVCMKDKINAEIRIGYGEYNCCFTSDSCTKVKLLCIKIEEMFVLKNQTIRPILNWLDDVSYPLCESEELFENAPNIEMINQIIKNYQSKNIKRMKPIY